VPDGRRPRVSRGPAAGRAADADRQRADRFRRRLADRRRLGFAISTGEWHHGLNAVAAGFTGPSDQRYAVNCGGAAHQCPRETLIETVAPALLDCIAKIVDEIGGTPSARIGD
jgi:DNA-binding IclR family transcriptional regulator